jgi:hypothetical protein
MEDCDYEATATHINDHAVLQKYMHIHSKDMEDPDYAATATLPIY